MALTYELIGTYTVGSPLKTVTIGSGGTLSQAYTDIIIRCSARSSRTGDAIDDINLSFNGNTTAGAYALQNASLNQISGTINNIDSNYSNAAYLYRNAMPADITPANSFGYAEFYVPNYTSNSSYKVVRALHSSIVNNATTGNYIGVTNGWFLSTSPITSISLVCDQANWMQHSRFDVYGIKKA